MTPESHFQSGAIAPVECLKEGWATIKDRYWLFLGITLVTMLIGGAVPIVLIGPMMCGLYLCLFAKSFATYAAAYRRVFPDLGPPGFSAPPPPPGSWAA